MGPAPSRAGAGPRHRAPRAPPGPLPPPCASLPGTRDARSPNSLRAPLDTRSPGPRRSVTWVGDGTRDPAPPGAHLGARTTAPKMPRRRGRCREVSGAAAAGHAPWCARPRPRSALWLLRTRAVLVSGRSPHWTAAITVPAHAVPSWRRPARRIGGQLQPPPDRPPGDPPAPTRAYPRGALVTAHGRPGTASDRSRERHAPPPPQL